MKDQNRTESDECNPLLGSEVTEGITSRTSLITGRHLLVWPVAFLFMTAYNFSTNTFSQYAYIKLQRDSFPNITFNTTIAYCGVDTNSTSYKIQEDVQQEAAKWGIYLYLAGGFSSVIASLVMGTFTDRLGRKFLFILPCIGTIFRTVWATVGMVYDLPLYYYVLGYFVEGCTGQVFNIFQVSYTYISDITVVGKQRSVGIVIIELAFGIAASIPVGYIIQQTNSFLLPFYMSFGLLGVTFLLVLLLPETFPAHVRAKRKYVSRLDNIKDAWGLFFGQENAGKRWVYITTLVAFILTTYDLFGRTAIEGLYLLNSPFCWDPDEIGLFGTLRTGCQQIIGMGLVIVLQLRLSDDAIAILGCISYGASFIVEAFATTNTSMYIGKCLKPGIFHAYY